MNSPTYSTTAGAELQHDLVRAGFYPQMVQDVLAEAMMSQPVLDHYVHLETHFDHNEVHRHITVMVLSEKFFTSSTLMISNLMITVKTSWLRFRPK